jgi:thiosulfate dehydrogenase [quinone] large subunit
MTNKVNTLNTNQTVWLILLRIAIGWHFLYEGLVKVFNPLWTANAYLMDSKGFFSPLFHTMATNQGILGTVDFLNQWGLVLIGLGLVLGVFTKLSTWAGLLLLAFYYMSHPAFIGLEYSLPSEGDYFIISKVAIEFFAMGVLLVFPTGRIIGFDRFIFKKKDK